MAEAGVRPLVAQALMATAAARPSAVALRYGGTSIAYETLAADAERVAGCLTSLGLRRGDRIGIQLGKRPEAVVAFWAALRAGGAAVALDPQAPTPYTAAILSDAGIRILVTTPDLLEGLAATLVAGELDGVIEVGGGREPSPADVQVVPWAIARSGGAGSLAPLPAADELAALAYTSGSSGRPKAVMFRHGTLAAVMHAYLDRVGITAADRLAVYPPMHGRHSMYGYVAGAMVGATAVLIPMEGLLRGSDIAAFIRDEGITVWKSNPYPLRQVAESDLPPGWLPSLRHVLGGDVWRAHELAALWRVAPNATVWHSYGSTEASTVFVDAVRSLPAPGERIPVGRPTEGSEVLLLDPQGRPVTPGEPGELLVRSERVFDGYWSDPKRTRDRFVDDPTGSGDHGGPWFRTGDLLRERPDGRFEFVGREDSLIRSRGFRIELGEVEAAVLTHPAVRDAIVVGVPHPRWGTEMVAFYEPLPGVVLDAPSVRAHVAGALPASMVPQRFECRARLPRLANGKLDRIAIREAALALAVAETTAEEAGPGS